MSLHWSSWGSPGQPLVLCVPGLSRNGRDFDLLAQRLSAAFHVVCVDLPGRGLSQWADQPGVVYRLAWMGQALGHLADQLDAAELDWVGTSYGGLLGIQAAGGDLAGRVRRLVVNDVGPAPLSPAAAQRLISYLSAPPAFPTVPELERYYRGAYAPFGLTNDRQWRAFTESSLRRNADGSISPDYDPTIASFLHEPVDIWGSWDRIRAEVLVVRGGRSDVLAAGAVAEMAERLPGTRWLVVPECGHAPALNTDEQLDVVCGFLGA